MGKRQGGVVWPHVTIWLVTTFLLAAVWVHLTQLIDQDRARVMDTAQAELANLVRINQEHAERTFYSADQLLLAVRFQYAEHGGRLSLAKMARERAFDTGLFPQVGVIDSQGLLAQSSLPVAAPVDLSDREHFKVHTQTAGDQLFVSKPVLGRASGKWTIQFSRPIRSADGMLQGVVVASLDPSYFSRFYSELNLGHGGVATLYRLDGHLFARKSARQVTFSANAASGPIFTRLARGETSGLQQFRSVVDGIERIYYFRKLADYPAVAIVGLDLADILTPHQQASSHYLEQALLASALLVGIGLLASVLVALRHRSVRALAQSEDRYRTLIDRTPLAVVVHRDGRVRYANAAALRLLRAETLKALLGRGVLDLVRGDHREQAKLRMRCSAEEPLANPPSQEVMVRLDGSAVDVEVHSTPIEYDGQTVVLDVIQDITQRRQAEAAVQAAAGYARNLIETSLDPLVTIDSQGHVTDVNQATERVTGYSRAELVGTDFAHYFTDPQKASEGYQKVFAEGSVTNYPLAIRHRSGAVTEVVYNASVYFGGNGEVLGVFAAARDISALMAAQAKLRQLSVAVEQSPASVVITDLDANIEYVNPRFCEVTGYSVEDVIGKNPRILQSHLTPSETYLALWDRLAQGQAWHGELINRRKNGEIYWEESQIAPVKGSDGTVTHYIAVKSDVTERKRLEERVREMAFQDALTNLPNRRLLNDRLQQALMGGRRTARLGALVYLDLDHFKELNDTHGHDFGDLLLIEVARRLISCVRESDTVSRMGGDEFVVLLGDLPGDESEASSQAMAVAEKIRVTLSEPYLLASAGASTEPRSVRFECSASLGVALFAGSVEGFEIVVRVADAAMYEAKLAGGNCVRMRTCQGKESAAPGLTG